MFKRKLISIILIILFAGCFAACNKDNKLSEPLVELLSPTEDSQIQVPDTLKIIFKIHSDNPVSSVAVSIVNADYTSISGVNTINMPELDKELQINKLIRDQQNLNEAPYHIKIAVNDGVEIWNAYFRIQLSKKSLVYKGFYLFSRPGIHQTKIDFYNRNIHDTALIQSIGDYVESGISGFFNRLFLVTEKPHMLHAYNISENILEWDADPQFPNPGFTDIQLDEEHVFTGMQNGQVTGYSQISGQQKMVTEMLTDTFPERICVLKDYIVGDYLARIGGDKILMTFYKETGVRKQRYPLNFTLVSMLNMEESNAVLMLGNISDKGKIAWYDAVNNIFEFSQTFDVGPIHDVCETTGENVLVAMGYDLYVYNYKMKILSYLVSLQDVPEKIYYEPKTKQLILLFEKSLMIMSYPALVEITQIDFEETLKGLQFYYQYD